MLMPSKNDFRAGAAVPGIEAASSLERVSAVSEPWRPLAYVLLVPFGLIVGAFGGLVFAVLTGIIMFAC